ncbi:hypothetical protein [Methylomicrobium album]|uniref:TubC N-terminal docking domain-containing protein n=1 Tax=Methylomicrobium album BG8 TaxID=686340 RepID=H8GQR8_METAL|nr:hypothetical protein [Methylomicrobium album]EIC31053.1 hypothetical protein Metal_3394 [Methylomicrobium album BG8]
MDALQRIKRAGFEVSLSGDTFTVSPASRLTPEQREFLKAHKAEIVKELSASDTTEPAPATDPLMVEIWTPSGTPMTTRARDAEHAAWLRQMNPRPENPAPKPDPAPRGQTISEAEHNAAGRYFRFLATWPDGRQCYLCQMPRMTIDEMQAQYPAATHIEPVMNEDYPHD